MDGSQVTGVIVSTGTINRKNYGINFNQALETGGVMLGKDVKLKHQLNSQSQNNLITQSSLF